MQIFIILGETVNKMATCVIMESVSVFIIKILPKMVRSGVSMKSIFFNFYNFFLPVFSLQAVSFSHECWRLLVQYRIVYSLNCILHISHISRLLQHAYSSIVLEKIFLMSFTYSSSCNTVELSYQNPGPRLFTVPFITINLAL